MILLATEGVVAQLERHVELEHPRRGAHVRLQRDPIRGGNAEHLSDHRHRELQRELGNHVDHAVETVEQFVGEPNDARAQVLDGLGRERFRDEPAQPGVVGRVEAEHRSHAHFHRAEARFPIGSRQPVFVPDRSGLTLAEARVAQRPLAILVATQHHESERAPERTRVLADRGVARVGIALALGREEDLGEEPVDVDGRCIGHGRSLASDRST